MNQEFLARMNASAKIHLTPAKVKGKYVIRLVANQENVNEAQIENAWKTIQEFATEIIAEVTPKKTRPSRPSLRKLDRTHSQRFSFTRNVSQEIYERQSSMYVTCWRFIWWRLTILFISQPKAHGRSDTDSCDRHRWHPPKLTESHSEEQRSWTKARQFRNEAAIAA